MAPAPTMRDLVYRIRAAVCMVGQVPTRWPDHPRLDSPVLYLLDRFAMSFFRRPDYQSDATRFINELKKQDPGLEARQRAGRALLWDRHVDRELQAEFRAARVPQRPYVYQTNTGSDD